MKRETDLMVWIPHIVVTIYAAGSIIYCLLFGQIIMRKKYVFQTFEEFSDWLNSDEFKNSKIYEIEVTVL